MMAFALPAALLFIACNDDDYMRFDLSQSGRQWKRVFIDSGNIPEIERDINYYRWLYTAVTRATEQVYLLEEKSNQESSE